MVDLDKVQIEELLKRSESSFDDFKRLYDYSIENSGNFWDIIARNMLEWGSDWKQAESTSADTGLTEWFSGSTLNASYNCLDRHAKSHPEKLALICSSESTSETRYITYQRLFEQVCLFANGLRSIGIDTGDTVCIYMPMIPEAIIAMLACARLGVTHSVVFAGFSPESLAARIKDAGAKAVITADQSIRSGRSLNLKEQVDKALNIATVEHCVVVKRLGEQISWVEGRDIWYHDLISNSDSNCDPIYVDANHPLFILYTSGSTGKPKGIVHSTAGYMVYASTTFKYIFEPKEKDVYWCTADIGWITGHTYLVYGPLSQGATAFIFEGNPMYPEPSSFAKLIDDFNISILYTAPTLIRTLMGFQDKAIEGSSRESLRLLGTVGEPINPSAWSWYHEKIGNSKCPIIDTWWQTETGGVMITPRQNISVKPGAAMHPFWGIHPVLLDDSGNEVKGEGSGALAIKGSWPGQMITIHNDHQRFLESYMSPFPGYYLSGDGARRDSDGDIWITGRIDDVMNVSGHRISTSEVESALVSDPDVAEAAVVSMPDEVTGEAIFAFVQMTQNSHKTNDTEEKLKQLVKTTIGSFAKPKHIKIVKELPKTRSGKIMRRVLRQIVQHKSDELGDLSTLAESDAVKEIISSI